MTDLLTQPGFQQVKYFSVNSQGQEVSPFVLGGFKINEFSTDVHDETIMVRTTYPDLQVVIDATEEYFNKLVDGWHKERTLMSSPDDIFNCPSYQKIKSMLNPVAEGYILKRMEYEQNKPDFWFDALEKLHPGVNPVPEESIGDLRAINIAWLNWLKSNAV